MDERRKTSFFLLTFLGISTTLETAAQLEASSGFIWGHSITLLRHIFIQLQIEAMKIRKNLFVKVA